MLTEALEFVGAMPAAVQVGLAAYGGYALGWGLAASAAQAARVAYRVARGALRWWRTPSATQRQLDELRRLVLASREAQADDSLCRTPSQPQRAPK